VGLLGDLRVVECATGIPAPYCGKLFADAGADVVKVEPAAGDPLRRWSVAGRLGGRDGALFRYLNHGKRSVVAGDGAGGRAELVRLVAGADVLLLDAEHAGDADHWHDRHPGLVVVAITPFGRSGPYAGRPATHFTLEAEAGSLAMRGRPDIPPFQAGGRIGEYVGGVYAAVAALACTRRARRTGQGELVDVSIHEALTISGGLFLDMMSSLWGRPGWPNPPRNLETPSIEPTADGWIGFNTNTRQQWEDFCVLIDRPDLLADEELALAAGRASRWEEWNEIVHAATRTRTTAELLERAAALRIPVAPVCDGRSVLEHPHFVARGVFVDAPDGTFRQPRPPYLIDGEPVPVPGPAPALGAHTGAVEPRTPVRPEPKARAPHRDAGLPLAGVRVVDLTNWWAGPAGSNMLAVLGADVVKIESVSRPDGMRFAGALPGQEQWWERGFMFLCANTNKREVTLDLGHPDGVELARRLIAGADVVMENYSPRVMDGFGLDWAAVHELNPRAVMVRMPAFGLDGPWRDHVGFAQTMEQVTGMAWITGHPDDQPRIPRGPCDPNAGMHATFALLAALEERDRTGTGVLVEAPMVEGALNVAAEQVLEWTAYGTLLERRGNRSPEAAPQGLYRCAGPGEGFLALSVGSDEQWQALCRVLGAGDLAADNTLDVLAGRHLAHDAIDARIAKWAAERTVPEAVAELVHAGVPAAELVDTRSTSEHTHLVARRFYEWLDHPVVGRHPHPSAPFRFASVDRWLHRPAPTLGQHNDEILADLGCDAEARARLAAERVIGTVPTGA
jgi:crotonobetainyl-CoA:carnitine CoA-transferase CaiB-like acyl-CoA transferase